MRKNAFIAAAAVALVAGGAAALASGGTAGDPLVSLAHLTDFLKPGLEQQVDSHIAARAEEDYTRFATDLEDARTKYEGLATAYEGWTYTDMATATPFSRADVIRIAPGSSFLLLDGTASVGVEGGEVIDLTDGKAYAALDALVPHHRYLAGEEASVSVTVLSELAHLAPVGYHLPALSGADTLPFIDITSTAWYYADVSFVCNVGLFNGMGENTFSPNFFMTRSMLATVLYRLAGAPTPVRWESSFNDVPAGSWFYDSVGWAAAQGIVSGMGDGGYAPNNQVTREQMATMLWRYYTVFAGLAATQQGDLATFPDGGTCSAWASEAMTWAVGAGILNGRSDGTLDPGGSATRAEVAAMLHRFSALLPH